MRSSFFGLELGFRGLIAQQRAIDVTGHNIANAHTEGFSRQRVNMTASPPLGTTSMHKIAGGHIGTGVVASSTTRLRDALLDHRFQLAQGRLGEWEQRSSVLHQIQYVIDEPGEMSIGGAFDQFWNSLSDVSNHPENIAARRALVETAAALADTINQRHADLQLIRKSLADMIDVTVSQVNATLVELRDINVLVQQSVAQGDNPNDLMDRRDLLLDRLARLTGVTVQHESRGDVTVFNGSQRILDISSMQQITMSVDPATGDVSLTWAGSGGEFVPAGGELKGMIAAHSEYLPEIIGDLETMVSSFMNEFNTVHRAGFGLDGVSGRDFFAPGTAGTMAVAQDMLAEPSYVAASASGAAGDNSGVLALMSLRHQAIVAGVPIDDYYGAIISRLGTRTRQADGAVDAALLIKQQVEIRRESVSGVSLDEEVTHLLRYQHAYGAAARFITTVDELLNTLINHMGR